MREEGEKRGGTETQGRAQPSCWARCRPYRRGRESWSSVWELCVGTVCVQPTWCASFGGWLGTVCVGVYRLRKVGLARSASVN